MAVKHASHNHFDWRPRSLQFGHWRDGGDKVAFAGDSGNRGRRSAGMLFGHHRENAFSILVHLYHHHPSMQVEVDGVRVHGKLGKPDDATARIPFQPKPYRDGSIPTPTRPRAYLRWRQGRHRFLAECRVTQARSDAPWELAAPYAVEADAKRLLPRVDTPRDWLFRPGRLTDGAFAETAALQNVSLAGAALRVDGGWSMDHVPGSPVVGALLHPSGKSLSLRLHVVHATARGRQTLIGASFSMVGLYGLRRLGRWIREI